MKKGVGKILHYASQEYEIICSNVNAWAKMAGALVTFSNFLLGMSNSLHKIHRDLETCLSPSIATLMDHSTLE